MRTIAKKAASVVLALCLAAGLWPAAGAVSAGDLERAAAESAAAVAASVPAPRIGSIGGEWAVIGLARGGAELPQSYWEEYYRAVEETVTDCQGVLHEKKYTEYSRVCLALTAIGADPADVAGYDLLAPLGDFERTVWQGVNGAVWALIALDSGGYAVPENPAAAVQATRQSYVDEILSRQLADGGWAMIGTEAEADLTGMALQALAGYREQPAVEQAVERGLDCLSGLQNEDGTFGTGENATCESVAQAVVALCRLGIDPEDGRFVKNGHTLLDGLLSYRLEDGRFAHFPEGRADQMATEQGFYALVAALRVKKGQNDLYDMADAAVLVQKGTQAGDGLPGKHADVKKQEVLFPEKSFSDLADHSGREAVEALARRGIVNGKDDGSFDPEASLTRAEFTAMVVRALGLTPAAGNAFNDVAPEHWYASYVGTAYAYGIVNGTGGGAFDPAGTITRQEAAVMVARAAKLCGLDTEMEPGAVLNMLSQFPDYPTVAGWARQSVAFCYDAGILDQNDWEVEPGRAVKRYEMAQMLCGMLERAKLL